MSGSTSSTTIQSDQIFSFLSGRNKNDNFLLVDTVSALVTTAIRWSNLRNAYGCDYKFVINNATNGSWVSIARAGISHSVLQGRNTASAASIGLQFTPDQTGVTVNNVALTSAFIQTSATNSFGLTSCIYRVGVDAVIKPHGTVSLDTATKFSFLLDLK